MCRSSHQEETEIFREKLERFTAQLEDFNPDVMKYVREHADVESVLEHPMYSLDPSNAWVRGRVVLVGDSVHVMPPNLAQVRGGGRSMFLLFTAGKLY